MFGYDDALKYINGYRPKVANKSPIVTERGIHRSPSSSDQYFKGALFIHTLRSVVNDIQARAGNQLLWIGPNHHYFIYETNFWPFLGFLFMPMTTLAYVAEADLAKHAEDFTAAARLPRNSELLLTMEPLSGLPTGVATVTSPATR